MKNLPEPPRPISVNGIVVPGYYVDRSGTLYSPNGLARITNKQGSLYAIIIINGEWEYHRLPHLILQAYCGKPLDVIRSINIDGNVHNNAITNLRWFTVTELLEQYKTWGVINTIDTSRIREEWRPLELDYPCKYKYEVSNYGNIRNAETKEIKQTHDNHGYQVIYYIDYKHFSTTRVMSLHRAVAKTFIPNPNNYDMVNHLNDNNADNHVWNLEWCDNSMNQEHAYVSNAKANMYTDDQIHKVCKMLEEGKHKQTEISMATGVDRKTVNDVYVRRRFSRIGNQYKFQQAPKWSPEIKELCKKYIREGLGGITLRMKLGLGNAQNEISFCERMMREVRYEDRMKAVKQAN